MKGKIWKRAILCILLPAVLFLWAGLRTELTVRRYTLESDYVVRSLKLVFLSDLHSSDYGEGQRALLDLVAAQEPDLVLLGGDWVDDDFGRRSPELAYTAARGLAEHYPTYYVLGNHEQWSGHGDEIKERLTDCGVTVLAGEWADLELKGTPIRLFGLDDPDVGEGLWQEQLAHIKQGLTENKLDLLLTHRPERVEDYGGFNLILAGHAHGGQWRLPGLVNGLYAPNQGFFPKYAGGQYTLPDGGIMVVGRGLSTNSTRIPRFFDPPEVVVVELV